MRASIFHFGMCFTAITAVISATSFSQAATVRINGDSTTPEEIAEVFDRALNSLAKAPGDGHEILLEGRFKPSATIQLQWFSKVPLTVTPGPGVDAILDGGALPKSKETLFVAGRNVTVKGVQFVNSRGHAIVIGGNSESYAIKDCSFEDCWQSAIHVWNDPHSILMETKVRGVITGNRISRFNLADAKWANDGITVFDQRVVIAGNSISDSPTETNGIRAMGRNLVIQRNHIVNVSRDDAGGIYLWGGPHASLFRGNVVRNNHVTGTSRGIYLDDGTSGAEVFENIIEDSSVCAVFVSGGRDNRIHHNVVDRSPIFVHLDSRCLGWDSRPEFSKLVKESLSRLRKTLADKTSGPLFRERYPVFQGVNENSLTLQNYGRPESNRIQENFVREVDRNWELMDFSKMVKTDFGALNELQPPLSFDSSEDLSQTSFRQRFGFQGFDRLENATGASSLLNHETPVPQK